MNGNNSYTVHAIYENFTHVNVSLTVSMDIFTKSRRFKIIPWCSPFILLVLYFSRYNKLYSGGGGGEEIFFGPRLSDPES